MATYNKRGYKATKPKDVLDSDNEFEEVLADGDSTTEEVFNTLDETANKTEEWVARNQKTIISVVIGIAVVALGYVFYNRMIAEPKQDEAFNAVYKAQTYFDEAFAGQEVNDSLLNLGLKGAEGKLGFEGVINEFGGTDAANVSSYYAGMSYLHLGEFKKAIQSLESFSTDDEILQAAAYAGIADALAETKKYDEAVSYYNKAAKVDANEYSTPRYLLKAAKILVLTGKKAEANKLFEEIKADYESSREAQNIDGFIEMTK